MKPRLVILSPSGVVPDRARVRRAAKHLASRGFDVQLDEAALARHQRFAGSDDERLAAVHRVAEQGAAGEASIALATRGGYGLTRLLDRLDWDLLARSVAGGLRWVGYSDMTALQMSALAHGAGGLQRVPHRHQDGAAEGEESGSPDGGWWHGPMASDDFGREEGDGGVDDVTEGCFLEAMGGELEAVGFRTEAGFDGLDVSGRLWGGNLCVLNSLLGTPHWPRIRGGVLFLEDVSEHPYRIERMLLQLQQAGVLARQRAVVLGDFSGYKLAPNDNGYDFDTMLAHLRATLPVPILTGLSFGHVPRRVTIPFGAQGRLESHEEGFTLGLSDYPTLRTATSCG